MLKQDYIRKRRLLSAKLIHARENAGLTQIQVERTGIVSQSKLSKLENSGQKVDFLVLIELAGLYNQPISFFLL